ncbi:unnamed protein product [Heligmosomoides polygyrus]|uniref:Hist_deacetyl domain-containing protein n=1 Tax=Heligmosomoides polygyrus TaxID=6339 RepID=A0A183GM89_HELPZ|nr:unnamed protein product [Heligmosomoides polygyrus]
MRPRLDIGFFFKFACSLFSGSDRALQTQLLVSIADHQCPLVFHEIYDVKMFGIEKCHPFDAGKWGRIYAKLKEWQLVSDESIVRPNEATRNDLLIAHTKLYLGSLYSPCIVAKVTEVPIACIVPSCITDKYFLRRMRYQCGGTVAAARIALDRGWAVHLGGGFHHAHRSSGGGFCVYADISLALKILFALQFIGKAMIVDVDAHQRDFGDDERVFILDVYNPRIYPFDHKAQEGISRSVHVGSMTSDREYLRLLKKHLTSSLAEFKCDLVVYNAGTDSLEGDPLGRLNLSPEANELVFRLCRQNETPIVMVTSGGYLMESADVIARSIRNLHEKELIQLNA